MAKYKDLHGIAIKAVSTDPSNAPSEGQVWYNTTTGAFKSILLSEAWSSGTALSTGRYNLAGSGTGTAGLVAGGTTPGIVTNTEHYNGTGWRNGGTLNVGRDSATMFGLSTAATFVGGYAPSPNGFRSLVEEYNGATWSEETDMPAPRAQGASAGTQTDGIVFGGNQGPPGSPETTATTTLEYNGSSWTTGGAMSVNDRYIMGCGGSQAQALRVGGESDTDATEEYDGSSWTTGGNLNTGRNQGAASGTNTAGLVFGGNPNRTNTEGYDGTSWSNKPALATGVEDTSGSAQGTNAEAFQAGQSASPISIVQNWNSAASVVTAGAFASLPNLNTARWGLGAAGTKSAGIVFGGRNPSVAQNLALTEEYSGSSWSEGPDLGQARRVCGKGTGTQTAALAHGGHYNSPSVRYKVAEEFDGSSWTNGGTSTNAHDGTANLGTLTAAASCGGYDGSPMNKTEEYDGTSFSTANDMPYSAYQLTASGSQTAGFVFGGGYPSVTTSANYDGTNWTSGPALVQATLGHGGNGGGGTQTEAIGAAGFRSSPPSYLSNSFTYDGTNFVTGPNVGTARAELSGQGANDSFYIAGGVDSPGSASNSAEEFTGETTALNVKTLTRS